MDKAPKGKNLVGIVPLSGKKSSFDLPWPDYMQPLRQGMLAVERSIYECAYAGCDSIWIVANDDVCPLVKSRLGDYVMNPRYFEEKDFVKNKQIHKHWIPIYYTAVSLKDRDRRDSLGWSILHGALTCFVTTSKMSKWVKPTKYFVSFPWGIYNPEIVKSFKGDIRGSKSFFLSHRGKTVRDAQYLGFTFFPEDWISFKRNIKLQCTGGNKFLPIQERWSSRHFGLDKIFKLDIISVDKKIEVEEYHSLESWEDLTDYYKSDLKIPRPSKQFIKPYFLRRRDN
tara:strand:- start:3334 stop:4182 length:849 start_codon:yes stop_codon:yes gene_type:complete